MSELKPRAGYTLKFKLEAVRLIKGGQVAAVTAKILGILHSEADALSGDKSLLANFNLWRITL